MMNKNLNETLKACIGACIPCIAIDTPDTEDVIQDVVRWAVETGHGRDVYVWRVSVGFEQWGAYVKDESGKEVLVDSIVSAGTEYTIKPHVTQRPELVPDADGFPGDTIPFAIDFIQEYGSESRQDEGVKSNPAIFILRDWHLHVGINNLHLDKQLALFEELSYSPDRTVVTLSPNIWSDEVLPCELSPYVYRMRYSLPDKAERLELARLWQEGVDPVAFSKLSDITESELEEVADATGGLTRKQVVNILCMSISVRHTYDLDYILTEKQELVKQAGFEITQGKAGFENIGGLTKLKEWITAMRIRFTERAREYANLEPPNGLLLAGVPGCGKSEIGKAISYEWGFNVLRVDASDLKGSLVGESEAKARKLLDTAKAAAPIIVFIDEAEKLLGASDGVNDGGAHDAVLGQFLSFMQDDDSGVFFVFTANKMEKFPPELIDRFEGRFFVDLPSSVEREAILKIHLTARNWGMAKQEDFDIGALVSASKSFSGRNIRDVITEASTFSLLQDRPMEQADVLAAFSTTIPTSKTKKTEIETMRTFVENGMMRKANDEPLAVKGKEAGKRFVSFN